MDASSQYTDSEPELDCDTPPASMAAGVKGSAVYQPAAVGDPRVVLSVKTVRGATPTDLQEWHTEILATGSAPMIMDAALMTFQSRDVRGGKGERDIFYTLFVNLARWNLSLAETLVDLIPEYGSWRDVFHLLETQAPLRPVLMKLVKDQLRRDESNANEAPAKVSLMAKWAPREGNKHTAAVKLLAPYIWTHDDVRIGNSALASYRKRMAALNRVIQTVEVYECANRWSEIDPKRVPARARELKMAAYLNEVCQTKEARLLRAPKELRHPDDLGRMACRSRFQEFFAAAAEGKIAISGAQTLYPHEIAKKMHGGGSKEEIDAWNAVWAQMLLKAPALGSSVAMCDFSGSMQSAPIVGDLPYWVSMAMGLLIASVNSGAFKGKFMTFDSQPLWHSIGAAATLQGAMNTIRGSIGQGLSTNFEAAMNLILSTLRANQTPPGQEPKNLIVITDMGWDRAAACRNWETHLERIKRDFKEFGWEAPQIVIWNVAASYSNDFHAQAETPGVIMLSGWSPSLFKILCEEGPRQITPYDALRAQLDDARYDPVRARVKTWLEGGWRGVV